MPNLKVHSEKDLDFCSSYITQNYANKSPSLQQEEEEVISTWSVISIGDAFAVGTRRRRRVIVLTNLCLYVVNYKSQRLIKKVKKIPFGGIHSVEKGYLPQKKSSSTNSENLSESEINPGQYALRIYLEPEIYRTYLSSDPHDDAELQKAKVEMIVGTILSARKRILKLHESVQSSPISSAPLIAQPIIVPRSHMFSIKATWISGSSETEGSLTITPYHITFKPTIAEEMIASEFEFLDGKSKDFDKGLARSPIFFLLSSVVDCTILPPTHPVVKKTLFHHTMFLEITVERNEVVFIINREKTEPLRNQIIQWVSENQNASVSLLEKSELDHNNDNNNNQISSTNFPPISSFSPIHPSLLSSSQNEPETTLALETVDSSQTQALSPSKPPTSSSDQILLTQFEFEFLREFMPSRYKSTHFENWVISYSTLKHGISLNTFYTKLRNLSPSVLVVMDDQRGIFGAFVTEPWRVKRKETYGNGESFLFKLRPYQRVYHWSHLNSYFMLSDENFISLGSGGDGFGLWIDSDFDFGASHCCDTYLNEVLSYAIDFKALHIEVWTLKK